MIMVQPPQWYGTDMEVHLLYKKCPNWAKKAKHKDVVEEVLSWYEPQHDGPLNEWMEDQKEIILQC